MVATTEDDPLLTTTEVAKRTRTPAGTLGYWRSIDKGPRSFRIGRRVAYRESDVERWIDEQEKLSGKGGN